MSKIIGYHIEVAGCEESLTHIVKEKIKRGWEPFGSLCLDSDGMILQPMIKREEPKL